MRCYRLGYVPRYRVRAPPMTDSESPARARIVGRSARLGHSEPVGDWENRVGDLLHAL